jgi:hypothetical protein
MKRLVVLACFLAGAVTAHAQIHVDIRFPRLQYVAYEPVVATVKITNLAGRDIELRDTADHSWFDFEVHRTDGASIAPVGRRSEPPLVIPTGQTVTRRVNLTPQFVMSELGPYHVRANVYFSDLDKFFYSPRKVFQVGDARPIWQRTVGVPEGQPGAGETRTYSLLSNRFPDHTRLYVRVEDKSTGAVYGTYSLGRAISYDAPQVELDLQNHLHVLHCSAPRTWAYSRVATDGQVVARSTFMETKTRPRLRQTPQGQIAVRGGVLDAPAPASAQTGQSAAKLSARPQNIPNDD